MAYTDFTVQGEVTLDTVRKDVKTVTRHPLAASAEEAREKFTAYCQQHFGDMLLDINIHYATEMTH